EHPDVLVAVVHLEGVSDELRDDRACPRPRPDRTLRVLVVQRVHLDEQLLVDVRAFFAAAAHGLVSFVLEYPLRVHRHRTTLVASHLPAAENELLARLVPAPGDPALGGHARPAHRMTAA